MANTLKFKRGLVAGIPTAALGEPLFTTDTFDLYIGNGTGNTRFQKYIASGATTQILRGDGSLYTFPLAISSPTNGQVLKYNGTSWVNDSDSGITGSGTTNYLPKFTGATTLGNSLLQETTNAIGLGLTPSVWNTSALGFEISQSNRAGFVVEHFSSSNASAGNSVNIGTGFYRGTADGSFRYQNSFTKPQMMYFFDGTTVWQQAAAGTVGNVITFSERMRIHATGNFGIGTGATDSGQRLQVVGTSYFSDSVGIGSTTLTGYNLRISNNITGITSPIAVFVDGTIQATATGANQIFRSSPSVVASATISEIRHFSALQGTFGAGSTVSTQTGFFVHSGMTGATTDYGFYGDLAAGTGIWNLYMNGTAANYLRGNTGINTTSLTDNGLTINQSVNGSNIVLSLRNDAGNADNEVSIKMIAGSLTAGELGTVLTHRRIGTGGAAFIIKTNATLGGTPAEALRVTQSQNLHVGTFSSDTGEKLQVTGTSRFSDNLRVQKDFIGATSILVGNLGTINASTLMQFALSEDGATVNGYFRRYRNGTGLTEIGFSNALAFTGAVTSTPAQRMLLDASGNLGIGTAGPAGKLDVYDSTNSSLYVRTGSAGANWLTSTTLSQLGTYTNHAFVLKSNDTERVRVFANGNLGIGTGSTDSGERLQVTGTAKITGNLAVDTNTLFVDATNNFVGIGTITPQQTLDIQGAGASSINLKNTTGGTNLKNVRLRNLGNILHIEGINDAYSSVLNQFSFDIQNNRFGINNPSPSYTLDVAGQARITSDLIVDTNTLFVDATNNRVGIGTTSPSDTFHVVGNILAGNGGAFEIMNSSLANVTCIRATGGGSSIMSTASWGNNIAIGTETAHDLILASNNTERMRLSSNGFLQHTNATNPTASVVDSYLQYSNDVTAGNAAPHCRTENGAVIKLYQETTAVGNSIISLGGGNAVLDDTTFDGYTLRQIVKALRNQGILA